VAVGRLFRKQVRIATDAEIFVAEALMACLRKITPVNEDHGLIVDQRGPCLDGNRHGQEHRGRNDHESQNPRHWPFALSVSCVRLCPERLMGSAALQGGQRPLSTGRSECSATYFLMQ
jgi:hypothetical protein